MKDFFLGFFASCTICLGVYIYTQMPVEDVKKEERAMPTPLIIPLTPPALDFPLGFDNKA